eukprot:7960739-Pyramimonas_sp.AAC.1
MDTVDELNQARRHGRSAEVARLSRLLAGTGVGPRKRDYRRAPVALPTGEELAERWSLPAGEGGMAATHIDWVQQAEDYVYHDVTGQEAQQFIA